MPTLTKTDPDGNTTTVTTSVPRELVTLRSQGFVEGPPAEEVLEELSVDDLRRELAGRQLPVTGRKADLVARLVENAPAAAAVVAASTSEPAESPTGS